MISEARFAGVDWGTTSLRLWLLTADGRVLAERRSDEGMSRLAPADFAGVLDRNLAALQAPADLPVLMCGMVGSRQGWREAPYADCPVALTVLVARTITVSQAGRDVRILPGIAQRDAAAPDVMRGEETKLIGLSHEASALVCMPGTHTKWVLLNAGRVERFRTTMAGELFALMAEHSLLRLSIDNQAATGDPDNPAFRAGLAAGLAGELGLTSLLFQLRAGSLLFGHDGAETVNRLSGLLIGSAIADGLRLSDAHTAVTLIADGRLAALYGAGLAMAGRRVQVLDADDAVRSGLSLAARQIWPHRAAA